MSIRKPYYMAIDQWGQTEHWLEYPRRDLLARCDRKHASKIYCDTATGTRHIGYAIARRWFTVYAVTSWRGGRL